MLPPWSPPLLLLLRLRGSLRYPGRSRDRPYCSPRQGISRLRRLLLLLLPLLQLLLVALPRSRAPRCSRCLRHRRYRRLRCRPAHVRRRPLQCREPTINSH